jgi:hypothetical protein
MCVSSSTYAEKSCLGRAVHSRGTNRAPTAFLVSTRSPIHFPFVLLNYCLGYYFQSRVMCYLASLTEPRTFHSARISYQFGLLLAVSNHRHTKFSETRSELDSTP